MGVGNVLFRIFVIYQKPGVMTSLNAIKVFEDKKVRTVWDSDKEEWYFSIVDVIAILTESKNPTTYWRVLKKD